MPTINFEGEEIECDEGETLRDVLLDAGLTPHEGLAETLNCGGKSTCGTCAVFVEGEVEGTKMEERRLAIPDKGDDVRLACQCTVLGDLDVEKP